MITQPKTFALAYLTTILFVGLAVVSLQSQTVPNYDTNGLSKLIDREVATLEADDWLSQLERAQKGKHHE